MGVGLLMRMVRAARGVKEREKKRKERGDCRRTTLPDWSHPSVFGLLSDLCLWGRWNLCVHTINISVSFAFCRGGTREEKPQTGEYRCFILVLPSLCLHFLLLLFSILFPNHFAHYLCHWSSVQKRFYKVAVLAERVWYALRSSTLEVYGETMWSGLGGGCSLLGVRLILLVTWVSCNSPLMIKQRQQNQQVSILGASGTEYSVFIFNLWVSPACWW